MAVSLVSQRDSMSATNTELTLVMNHFDVHNRTEGKSERSCLWYQEVLSMFRKWLAANGLSTAMAEASELTVRQFILDL